MQSNLLQFINSTVLQRLVIARLAQLGKAIPQPIHQRGCMAATRQGGILRSLVRWAPIPRNSSNLFVF